MILDVSGLAAALDLAINSHYPWRGEEPLWKVFWNFGVAAGTTIIGRYGSTLYSGQRPMQ